MGFYVHRGFFQQSTPSSPAKSYLKMTSNLPKLQYSPSNLNLFSKEALSRKVWPNSPETRMWPLPLNKNFYYTHLLSFYEDDMFLFLLRSLIFFHHQYERLPYGFIFLNCTYVVYKQTDFFSSNKNKWFFCSLNQIIHIHVYAELLTQ